jgi:hypothetical protein
MPLTVDLGHDILDLRWMRTECPEKNENRSKHSGCPFSLAPPCLACTDSRDIRVLIDVELGEVGLREAGTRARGTDLSECQRVRERGSMSS